jgi:hypothetical protein
MKMEDEIKRWTAKRKSALVLDITQGKTCGDQLCCRAMLTCGDEVSSPMVESFAGPCLLPVRRPPRLIPESCD